MEPASLRAWAVVVVSTDTVDLFLEMPLVCVCALYPEDRLDEAVASMDKVACTAGSVHQAPSAVMITCLYNNARRDADGRTPLHVDTVHHADFTVDTFAPYRLYMGPGPSTSPALHIEARKPFPFLFVDE